MDICKGQKAMQSPMQGGCTQYSVHPNVDRIRTRQAEISLHHAKLHEPGRPGFFEKFASSAGFQIPTNDHGLRARNSTVLVHWSVGL